MEVKGEVEGEVRVPVGPSERLCVGEVGSRGAAGGVWRKIGAQMAPARAWQLQGQLFWLTRELCGRL